MDSLASREIWESRVTGVSWDLLDPEVRTDLRGPRVAPVFLEMLALLDPTVKRANWVFQGCQDIQEDQDQRDLRDSKVSPEPTERKEQGDLQGRLAQEDREDQRGLVERGDQGDQQEKLDQRVPQEVMAPQDLPARGVFQGLKDQQDSPDQRAHPDLLGKMVCPATLDREERLVSKARLAHLDPQEWLDLRAPQVRLDQWESVAIQDPQAHPVSRVFLDLLAKRELRVTQVPLARLVRTVPLV